MYFLGGDKRGSGRVIVDGVPEPLDHQCDLLAERAGGEGSQSLNGRRHVFREPCDFPAAELVSGSGEVPCLGLGGGLFGFLLPASPNQVIRTVFLFDQRAVDRDRQCRAVQLDR